MSRILLADDSPHAQRMGERILREEGYEVVSITDGQTALVRLGDVDPDLIVVDALLPRKSGYEICELVKAHPQHRFVRVVLTTGILEEFDEERARQVKCDGVLKRPFEASTMLAVVNPLARDAEAARAALATDAGGLAPATPEPDPQRVRAAVVLALDAALPKLVDEITERVLLALKP